MPLVPPLNLASLNPQNFVGAEVFSFSLSHEVQMATRLQYCLSILCLTPDLGPSEATPPLTEQMAKVAISCLRATDLASTLPPASTMLLLIDADLPALPGIFQRLKDALQPLLVPARPKEHRLTLSGGGGCYPPTATSASGLLQQALELMSRARADGGDRLYLPA